MKRNERITSSWGFLTQGAKTMMCLLVLTLSVQAVLAQGVRFDYAGLVYELNGEGATCMGFAIVEAQNASTIIIPDYVYKDGVEYPVTYIAGKNEGVRNSFEQAKNAKKLVIGNNVTKIGKKAFEHFGGGNGPFTLVIGSSLVGLDTKTFEHFAENKGGDCVILTIDDPALISGDSFEHCQNATFYVKDEETYQKFISDPKWAQYNNNKGNKYNWPIPADVSLKAGLWQTAVFPENMTSTDVQSYFGNGTLLAKMSTTNVQDLDGEMNYLVRFEGTTTVTQNTPMLIKPGDKDCRFVSQTSYGVSGYGSNPVIAVADQKNKMTIRMIGICDDDHQLTDGQIYFRNYGDGNMRFFMYKEGDGSKVMVKRGKCIWEIVDESGNIVTNKVLDYKIDEAATAIEDVTRKPAVQDGRIYSLTGQYEGTSLENLPKGIHIMNGRKFVVK